MEGLIQEQENTLSLIKKTGVNYKKTPKVRLTKVYLQIRVQTLEQYWEKFKSTHFEITKISTADIRKINPYFTDDWFIQAEQEYIDIKTDMMEKLETMEVRTSSLDRSLGTGSPSRQSATFSEVRLPKIELPHFNGNYHDWSTYRDMFTSLIHDNVTLSKVQKLHYLKSSLTGEPEQLLKHVQITEKNYDMAWDMLIKRYNNRRMIVTSILNKLVNQKKLSSGTASGLKELLDTTVECMNNLKNNEVNTVNWDILVIYLVVNKLDDETRKAWEEEIAELPVDVLPTFNKFTQFLETKFRVLEMVQQNPSTSRERSSRPKSFLTTSSSNNQIKCSYCEDNHTIFTCTEFANLSVEDRVSQVQAKNLCFNCLSPNHPIRQCKSKVYCQHCQKRHHTLLHYHNSKPNDSNLSTNTEPDTGSSDDRPVIRSHLTTQGQSALMATALINIDTGRGLQLVRALIDPCSQESFISESTMRRLQLRRKPVDGQVVGVDQMAARIKFASDFVITSRVDTTFTVSCTAYVVNQVTDILPTREIKKDRWPHLLHLTLADPTFYTPGGIDMLLGVNIYTEILLSGVVKGEPSAPIAQQTRFGWIVSGGISDNHTKGIVAHSMHLNVSLDVMMQKFWENERLESEENDTLTPQEVRAEDIYVKTVTRDPTGRYVVALPFVSDNPILPQGSRGIAMKRLQCLEKRFAKDEGLRKQYNAVMKEYIDLKHMELVEETQREEEKTVYLPHHAVVREDKETTKLRTVFDASAKGTNGVSLNDQLLIGPSLQTELRDIMLRWRMHEIGFIADVVKMYRQILVRNQDTDYQRIVWRFNDKEEIKDYRLLTVTFGLACAPYLAIRTLRRLSEDSGEDFPLAKMIIENDVYVDDILSGSYGEESALEAQKQLINMLRQAGLELQKWSSNKDKLLNNILTGSKNEASEVNINKREVIKALGIKWIPKNDELQVTFKIGNLNDEKNTKRKILSVIASLFDPMGWLAPAIVTAKIFMQRLWILNLSWDEELPQSCRKEWANYQDQLNFLTELKIPRWIGTTTNLNKLELHGFADASMSAYGAVVYSRAIREDGSISTSLLMAKTRVAPVKPLTLPRLELSAAVLLSKLLKHVASAIKVIPEDTYAWSDSQVVLAWIKGDPTRWKTYVRNRVLEIHSNLRTTWLYVNTKHNPADAASRGVQPEKLKENEMWWNGPAFLRSNEFEIPRCDLPETQEEAREPVTCVIATVEDPNGILTLLSRYSSLKKLLDVIAYCRRWLLLKQKKGIDEFLPNFITNEEREDALTICIRLSQKIEFSDDIERLRKNLPIKRESRLIALNPFLDEKGVLRVGGRLNHAEIEFLSKYPIIISSNNVLLPLLLRDAHLKTLHGGPQMMITYLRGKYWLIAAGNTVKRFVRNCMICAKQRNITRTQLMGNLPEFRVRPSRPFSISGVDFAGPISVRMSKGRGAKSHKAYIALFICMATKAIHVELVSDMTTQAFLAAFRRFVSRRGACKEMWSDHGTTFVAANKELLEMWKQGQAEIPDDLRSVLDEEGTKWKFIPPGAPNFGGLWEAGVKSIKFHLKRTIGDSTLTFEELYTLLVQIEACLNSRPLAPMSDHPADFEPITPAHFLIGEPTVTLTERNCSDLNMHTLSRWQAIQKMLSVFWRKWQTEYMTRLQQRPKWTQPKREFEIGDLVLVRDSRFPPSKWLLGRVLKKYSGKDGVTRVYDIRTASGTLTRAISKLCPLPDI